MSISVFYGGHSLPYLCPRSLFRDLLSIIPVYSKAEVLKENLYKTFDVVIDFCSLVYEDLESRNERANVSRMKSRMIDNKRYIRKMDDREKLVRLIYDWILSCDGYGLLGGFSTWAPIEKGYCWYNPERRRITDENL